MKRPSCLQKLVTGKPPWPRQGMSFRGPSQLGQHFPAKEQQKVSTCHRAMPADPGAQAALVVLAGKLGWQRIRLGQFYALPSTALNPWPQEAWPPLGPDQSHMWLEEAAYRIGYFTG